MTRSRLILAAVATALLIAVAPACAQGRPPAAVMEPSPTGAVSLRGGPEPAAISSDAMSALGAEVARWVAEGDPLGAELLVIAHGEALYHGAWGWSDREEARPLERNSIYRIRSMTKPLVGTSVLMLADEGGLALDDPAAKYLSSFDNERSRAITIRQLLTHTSGLKGNGQEGPDLPQALSQYRSLRAFVDDIGALGPIQPPGTFHYSDRGSSTLGAIVAEVAGMPVEQFIAERILGPLEMTDTHARYEPGVPWSSRMNSTYRMSRQSCTFEKYWDPSRAQEAPFFRASGGLYSTVTDYAKFLASWMAGGVGPSGRLLSAASVAEALTLVGDRGEGRRYGMQWTLYEAGAGRGGSDTFGHGGSDGTLALAFPALDAMVLLFTQSRQSRTTGRFTDLLSRTEPFAAHLPDSRRANPQIEAQWKALAETDRTEGTPAVRSRAERLAAYVGTYGFQGLEMKLSAEGERLQLTPPGQSLAVSLRAKSDRVFLGYEPCREAYVRITFDDVVGGEAPGFLIDTNEGWSARFERRP